MIKKTFKYLGLVVLTYVFLCILTPYNSVLKNRSDKNQINYLSDIIDKGYDNTLQNRYPEGKIFSNALLALSTVEYCDNNQIFNEKYSKIVDNCIRRIQSKRAVQIFNESMIPKYGMFYNGWSNLVYITYKESQLFKYSKIQENVSEASNEIEVRITKTQNDSLRTLDSYSGTAWPADNMIGISSISNDTLQAKWIEVILNKAKHESGLINHISSNVSEIRGSSNAMITYCLGKSHYQDVDLYNEIYCSKLIDEYLGIQLVKENENGSNSTDVDSGPVVFGYGASATIMNIKTQASLGNEKSRITWAVMNTLALPVNIFNEKYYLMKKEPMLDLFMLWGSTEL